MSFIATMKWKLVLLLVVATGLGALAAWRVHARNMFVLGLVGKTPAFNGVVVVKNNFHNVPTVAPNSGFLQNPGIARPEQFFIEPLELK